MNIPAQTDRYKTSFEYIPISQTQQYSFPFILANTAVLVLPETQWPLNCDNWAYSCMSWWLAYPTEDLPSFFPIPPALLSAKTDFSALSGFLGFDVSGVNNIFRFRTILVRQFGFLTMRSGASAGERGWSDHSVHRCVFVACTRIRFCGKIGQYFRTTRAGKSHRFPSVRIEFFWMLPNIV